MQKNTTVDRINQQLQDFFGIDTDSNQPIWRVVWTHDQFEKRLMKFTDSGVELLHAEVREVPKYRQWCDNRYMLERLVMVPDQNLVELAAMKKSYEPIWNFEDKNGNPLPPRIDACQFIINTIYAAQYGTKNLRKMVDPDNTQENFLENQRKRVDGIVEELFGEQSSLQGTTKTGESIIVPQSFETSK